MLIFRLDCSSTMKKKVTSLRNIGGFSTLYTVKSEDKNCGFNVGDYVECRLLGYENAVRTSQET
jgi:hypothetical protein